MKETGELMDPFVLRIVARSGTMSRTCFALLHHPEGLSLKEIADITSMTPGNISAHGVRNLFRFQLVDRVKDERRGTVYRFRPMDMSVASRARARARPLQPFMERRLRQPRQEKEYEEAPAEEMPKPRKESEEELKFDLSPIFY